MNTADSTGRDAPSTVRESDVVVSTPVMSSCASTWELASDDARWVLDAPGIDWFELATDSRAELIKRNVRRRVYRVDLGERAVFVKHHGKVGLIGRVKRLLGRDSAYVEFRVAAYARAHGVPAIELVARGVSRIGRQPGTTVTISPEIAGAVSLATALDDASRLPDPRRRSERIDKLLVAAARLLATSHDAGFLHTDGHPGNLLVTEDDDGRLQCHYVDLYDVRLGRSVTDADAARAMAGLANWCSRRVSRTQRVRALRIYMSLRMAGASRLRRRQFMRLVVTTAERQAFRLFAKRDRRIGRSNAYFTRLESSQGWRAIVTLRYRDLARLMPVEIANLTRRGARGWLEDQIVYPPPDHQPSLRSGRCTEQFASPGWATVIAWRVGASPAWSRYRTSVMALNRDIPAAVGQAYVVCSSDRRHRHEAWIHVAPDDSACLADLAAESTEPALRRKMLERFGRLLAITFDRGLAIRAPRLTQVMVCRQAPDGPFVYWRGIDGQPHTRPLAGSVRRWVLVQLARHLRQCNCGSTIAAARVMRSYVRCSGSVRAPGDWRTLWRQVHRLQQ